MSLQILLISGQAYMIGQKPPSRGELAESLGVSERLINELVEDLIEEGLLLAVEDAKEVQMRRYIPGKSIESLKICDVFFALRTNGLEEQQVPFSQQVNEIQKNINSSIVNSLQQMTIKDMILKNLGNLKKEG